MSATAAAVVGVVAATATAATVIAAATAAAVSAITEEDYDKDNEPEDAVVVTTVAEHDCSLSPHFRFYDASAQVCGRGQSISYAV